MNIGIVLISNEWAGAERVVYSLSKSLSKIKGIKVTLFINETMFQFYEIEGVERVNLGKFSSSNKLVFLLSYFKLRRNLKKEINNRHIEILNSHMEVSYLISPKKKLVIVSHGDDIENFLKPPSVFNRIFLHNMVKSYFDDCKKIISVSNWQKQKLPKIYKEKTTVIPNGIDTRIFKKLENIKHKKVILFTGRYIERKGILEVLKVAKELPQYDFWFAGYGPLMNRINLPNTTNLGFKSTDELVKLYNEVEICAFPAYWEAFPLSGLEAMACGRAVIATPLGFSEYIENGKDGLIIPSKDKNALKKAIIELMTNNKLRRKLEVNARNKVLNYSWGKVAEQYLNVFKQVNNIYTSYSVKENLKNYIKGMSIRHPLLASIVYLLLRK